MEKKHKVSIIGAGSWGTTLGIILARNKVNVSLTSLFPDHNLKMQRQRQNSLFLKGAKFPSCLKIESSLRRALDKEIIVIAVPVKFLRESLRKIRQYASFKGKLLLSLSKGIEAVSLQRPSEIIRTELALKKEQVYVLSGPTIAKEVLGGIPAAAIVAGCNIEKARRIQKLFSNSQFRLYLSRDVVGVEIGGALKNIIAIACGIADGLGFGTNTKAALLTRGLAEISRMGKKLGAGVSTFFGLSGLGDLATTCFSPYSRNRFVGEEIGKGKKLKDIIKRMNMVAEGVESVRAIYTLSQSIKVDMPISRQVYYVLFRRKSPRKAVEDLMKRPLKAEKI